MENSENKKDPQKSKVKKELTTEILIFLGDGKDRNDLSVLREKDIREIDLSSDKFSLMSIEGFNEVEWNNLSYLNLSDNQLIHIDVINKFQKLKTIYASNNQIKDVKLYLPNLIDLDLSNNFLQKLPVLEHIPELQSLNLRANEIFDVKSFQQFKFLPKLTTLDLSKNRIMFTAQQFINFQQILADVSLQDLKISGNPFTEEATFKGKYQFYFIKSCQLLKTLNGEGLPDELLKDIRSKKLFAIEAQPEQEEEIEQQQAAPYQEEEEEITFQQMNDMLEVAFAAPAKAMDKLKQLSLMVDKIINNPQIRQQIFTVNKPEEVEELQDLIDSFMENASVLLQNQSTVRLALLRTLANLSVIEEAQFKLGEKVMELMNLSMIAGPQDKNSVKKVVEDMLIPKLTSCTQVRKIPRCLLKGLTTLSENGLAKCFLIIVPHIQKWISNEKKALAKKLNSNQQVPEGYIDLTDEGLELIAATSSHQKIAKEMVKLELPQILSELFRLTEKKNRQISILKIFENTARYSQEAAEVYKKANIHKDLDKKIFKDINKYKTNKFSLRDQNENQQDELKNYQFLSSRITALGAMGKSDIEVASYLLNDNLEHVGELATLTTSSQVDPVLLRGIVQFLLDLFNSKIIRERGEKENPPCRVIAEKMSKVTPMLAMIGGGKAYQDICKLAEVYQSGTIIGKEAVSHLNNTNKVIHNLFEVIINLIAFFSKNAKQEADEFHKVCCEISQTLNNQEREQNLFMCLELPDDNVKLAVVKCLDEVPIEEIDTEEIGQLVRLLGNYKNLGAGETELVLSNIFLMLSKLAIQKKEFRDRFSELAVGEATEIICKNQQRNLIDDKGEQKQKDQLMVSCVYFLKVLTSCEELHFHFQNQVLKEQFRLILKTEEQFTPSDGLASQIELTAMGRNMHYLMQNFKDQESLHPYDKPVAFRVIRKIADILMFKSEPDLNLIDPWNSERAINLIAEGKDTVARVVQIMTDRKQDMEIEELMPWTTPQKPKKMLERQIEQHTYFCDQNGVEKILLFLLGKHTPTMVELEQQLKKEFNSIYDMNNYDQNPISLTKVIQKEAQLISIPKERQTQVEKKQAEKRSGRDVLERAFQAECLEQNLVDLRSKDQDQIINQGILMGPHKISNFQKQKCLIIAAALRAMFASIEYAPSGKQKRKAIKQLRVTSNMQYLTQLCESTGWINGAIGGKYLRVVQHALRKKVTQVDEEIEIVKIYEIVANAIEQMLQILSQKFQSENVILVSQDLFLCSEIASATSLITQSVFYQQWGESTSALQS